MTIFPPTPDDDQPHEPPPDAPQPVTDAVVAALREARAGVRVTFAEHDAAAHGVLAQLTEEETGTALRVVLAAYLERVHAEHATAASARTTGKLLQTDEAA